jgi:hypothetical protein
MSTDNSEQISTWTGQSYSLPSFFLQSCDATILPNNHESILVFKQQKLPHLNCPIILRTIDTLTILGASNSRTSFSVNHLTIVRGVLIFENIDFTSQLIIAGLANVSFKSCSFNLNNRSMDQIVEVRGSATQVTFSNCTFERGGKAQLAVKNGAKVVLKHCRFHSSPNKCLIVLNDSNVEISNSEFKTAERFSIYVFMNANITIDHSHFGEQKGKFILIVNNCNAFITDCEFWKGGNGGISVSDNCKALIKNCTFKNMKQSSIHAIGNSMIEIDKVDIIGSNGNGMNIEYSKGFIGNCHIEECKYPAIAITGVESNPVIDNCLIENCSSFGIVIRDASVPVLSRITMNHIQSDGFSISDFSRPLIRGCRIADIGGYPFSIFNCSRPHIEQNTVICNVKKGAFRVFTTARPHFSRNVFIGAIGASINPSALIIPDNFENNRLLRNDSYFSIHLREGGSFELETEVYPPHNDDRIPNPQHLIDLCTLPRIECNGSGSESESGYGKCMHCHRKEASLICSPCGHRVICRDCGTDRTERQNCGYESHCPLCDIPVHRYSQVYEEDICVNCRECSATTIIQPCGHKCVCYECGVKISQEQKKCPLCQGPLFGIKQEFPIYESVIEQEITFPRIEGRLDEELQDDNISMIRPLVRRKSVGNLDNRLRLRLRLKRKPENGRSQMN